MLPEEDRPPLLPMPKTVPELKARLRMLWKGEIPLFETFWLYFFLIVFILASFATIQGIPGILFNIVMLLWTGFMVRPIYLAADRYRGERIWATSAKILAVLIAVIVVGQLLNL